MVILRDDLTTRAAYTSDASIYRRFPQAVVEPSSVEEIREALAIARENKWSVTSRGGGTSVAGNAIGEGLIIDLSRNFNRIISVDPDNKIAVVEPGVVCDQLRDAVSQYGLTYGPDPSTHSRCTLGGMVANNACGSHSIAWGTSADNLVAVTMLLADGREIEFREGGTSDPEIDAQLGKLRDQNLALFRTELGTFPRQVSGYGLHYLLKENSFDTAKALAGSEGTLGVITQLTVRLVSQPRATALTVIGFADPIDAARAAPRLKLPGVATIEGMGGDLVEALRMRTGRETAGSDLPKGGAWLYCEVVGESVDEARDFSQRLPEVVKELVTGFSVVVDPGQARKLWEIREAGAGIVTRLPDGGEAWPGWEDSAVPVERLAEYLSDIYALLETFSLRGIPYGHFGEGCVHLRISFDFLTDEGVQTYRDFMIGASQLVQKYGGSISGEHGDGRARSEMLSIMYSKPMLDAFVAFKSILDPHNLFNPGVLVNPEPITQGIRPGKGSRQLEITPVHAFSRDNGSFASAVNRCVGVGSCRSDVGAMCPSFQASHDEISSTRGRSRVLAEMLRGEKLTEGWHSSEVRDALDLCLSCKACVAECPVNVDMATYKSEFLHHFHGSGLASFFGKRRRPRAHFTMGWLPLILRIISKVPGLVRLINALESLAFVQSLTKRLGGIEPRRALPTFATTTLRRWHQRRNQGSSSSEASVTQRTVVIWPDTFTNFAATGPGEAAVEALEAMGYRVIIPSGSICCGLTWHSTGQLDQAIKSLTKTLDTIQPLLEAGLPIISLEPSCTAMLKEESVELLPRDPRAQVLSQATLSFGAFVSQHLDKGGYWPFGLVDGLATTSAVCQVHCHQKATGSYDRELAILEKIGVQTDVVAGGCCGLAGNWGFEPGHFDMSQTLAERELFPKIRNAAEDAVILADGFSCRTQIAQGTTAEAAHLSQLLQRAIKHQSP
jgi:FAD/FMN-containing dehydrogenase/Fe-S oxidoreductase